MLLLLLFWPPPDWLLAPLLWPPLPLLRGAPREIKGRESSARACTSAGRGCRSWDTG